MDKHAISIKEKLTVYTSSNTVTLPSSEHNKVYIWGYELCKGSDWNNFLEVVNKLGEENKQLKEQLAEKDKIEYTDTINFVETSEPDIVAKELDRLNEQLAESEKQRQHLKDWLDDEILTSVDNESYYATINEYEEEVKKLKQQLEETEEERDGNYENYSICWKDNEYLKQQLEEKDKEISNLNGLVRERDKQIKNLKTNKKKVIEHKNKTKISFAVEQLELAKEKIIKVPIADYDFSGNFEKMYKQDAIRQIDNKIKELKGEK